MNEVDFPGVTVIVPIYNSETTLRQVFEGLEKQKYPVRQVLLIDNNSRDSSLKIVQSYARESKFNVSVIQHKDDRGLSYSYNEAIQLARTPLIITLQSDCVIQNENDIVQLVQPFIDSDKIVVACSLHITPMRIWDKYPFWQKSLFSRLAGKVLSGRNGRFCCFSVAALKEVDMFDQRTYRTAGEDGDVLIKLSEKGDIVDVHEVVVQHLHNCSPRFLLKDYIYKENQLAEAVGACLRNNMSRVSFKHFLTAFIRPALVVGLCIPGINFIVMGLVFWYSFYYTKKVFIKEWRNVKILLLPFVNIFLLFSYSLYFAKGFILRKQTL